MHRGRGLLEVAPIVLPNLEREEWKALRATCREARAIADRSVTSLTVNDYKQRFTPKSPAQLIDFVRGMLARGASPDKLALHPWALSMDVNAGELAATVLGILAVFAEQLPSSSRLATRPSVTHISLDQVAYTDTLASAVRSAAPLLASLDIYTDLSSPDDLEAATPGLCRLITTCAPSLTSLTLSRSQYAVPQPLADAIATCTRLQHLRVVLHTEQHIPKGETPQEDSTSRVVEVVHGLPSLRSLNLEIGNANDSPVEVLSTLTQLTSLKVYAADVSEGYMLHVLQPLRNLARLVLTGTSELCEPHFTLLAAELEQLTYFKYSGNELGLESAKAGKRGCVPLPPALRELRLKCSVTPRDLLALQLPPGLTRLTVQDLVASAKTYSRAAASGGAGGNAPAGAAQVVPAVGGGGGGSAPSPAVPPSPCPGFDELLEAVALLFGRFDGSKGLRLLYDWEPSPLTWPVAGDGHVRVFAALRPLRLRKLSLFRCALGVRDVGALVEQLPELQVLKIYGQLHPAAVPLLARLPRLRHLELQLPLGHGTDTWASSGTAVAAALMPVVLGAPCLKQLEVLPRSNAGYDPASGRRVPCSQPAGRELVTALLEGVRWVQGELRGMGRDPDIVKLGCTWSTLLEDE